ncbi:hypothetical protein HMPREF9004_1814 [Schaalia cardiffensis F0333]|uniref:Uncharacterized protein n=2 Tax=Schaalia TaxID=2529408 RepID=N6X8F7_9ACTO|nr:hypothetical protein HMPREF9004_1814 [Schaalia cardiffensis F0333]
MDVTTSGLVAQVLVTLLVAWTFWTANTKENRLRGKVSVGVDCVFVLLIATGIPTGIAGSFKGGLDYTTSIGLLYLTYAAISIFALNTVASAIYPHLPIARDTKDVDGSGE